MRELFKSKELRSMAVMVLCYNTCIELTEVLWKALLRKSYPEKSAYMSYMAVFSQTVGVISFVLQFAASGIISGLGWKIAALITPLTMGLLAIPFFFIVTIMMKTSKGTIDEGASSTAITAGATLAAALAIGSWQNVASKVTKYSLFDPTKEIVYIVLGPEAKVKGKAAVDVMGARLGRSIGSASQQVMVVVAAALGGGGSILTCAPYLGVLYATTVCFWIHAVHSLSKILSSTVDSKKSRSVGDASDKGEMSVGTIRAGKGRAKITAKVS